MVSLTTYCTPTHTRPVKQLTILNPLKLIVGHLGAINSIVSNLQYEDITRHHMLRVCVDGPFVSTIKHRMSVANKANSRFHAPPIPLTKE